MRLDLIDEATRRFVLAFLPGDQVNTRRRRRKINGEADADQHQASPVSGMHPDVPSCPDVHSLADELIKKRCGTHSLGLVYEFLLRTHGAPEKARAQFVNFLSGRWSQEWLEAARQAVEAERLASSQNGRNQ
jgi:hypothetical protein